MKQSDVYFRNPTLATFGRKWEGRIERKRPRTERLGRRCWHSGMGYRRCASGRFLQARLAQGERKTHGAGKGAG